MDARSETYLLSVHPDLTKVMRAASQVPQPFAIDNGLRSTAAEHIALSTGHSETMRSRHLPDSHYTNALNPDGLACAVDVVALIDGKMNFAKGREAVVFGAIASQVRAASEALSIPIQWGGAVIGAWTPGVVSHWRDWGHFQLTWSAYP